jgi:hypothetical protein
MQIGVKKSPTSISYFKHGTLTKRKKKKKKAFSLLSEKKEYRIKKIIEKKYLNGIVKVDS